MAGLSDPERAPKIQQFFAILWDSLEGWVATASGQPYLEDGKVRHQDFHERFFAWPRQADALVEFLAAVSVSLDCWFTPGLSYGPTRHMRYRRNQPSRFLWVDCDAATSDDLDQLRSLAGQGGFIVRSGRGPSHVHGYVRLHKPIPPESVASLNRRLVRAVHGDASPSALNGYLRPPFTWNHKRPLLDGSPAPLVSLDAYRDGAGWDVTELDRLLPPVLHLSGPAGPHDWKPQPLPESLPLRVAAILADPPDWPGDRSARLFQLVAACRRTGLSESQTLTLAEGHQPSRLKYGPRLRTETARVLLKLRGLRDLTRDARPPR